MKAILYQNEDQFDYVSGWFIAYLTKPSKTNLSKELPFLLILPKPLQNRPEERVNLKDFFGLNLLLGEPEGRR